jgi:biotin carboxylase/acetyl-CoA carboxylase carboxyltransferase component
MRSVRRWMFEHVGDANAVKFYVMATPEDVRVNAEYIRMADFFEVVPGGSNKNNYANVDLIVEVALRNRVDAVLPGWGHASENPKLPERLLQAGIAFCGPSASAMRDLGDKICSLILAQSAEVRCAPWSGDGVTVNYKEEGLPADLAERATVHTEEEARTACDRIGFPCMIKASEGGGGKGIRRCETASQLRDAFRNCQEEVPGSPIFIMKLVNSAYHLEVQVLGDQHGQALSLYGRDCSVQRRHQKIIEEAPVRVAPRSICEQMEQGAVRLAKAVSYCSTGTLEFLYSDNSYCFLEMNPRLQVEHTCTEMVTGVNLPACQVLVAMGVPLHRIPEIRLLYAKEPYGDSPIDFEKDQKRDPSHHVIAVRLTAENPDDKFAPSAGRIDELTFRPSEYVSGYFSVASGGGVHEFADSQFGHIFARAATRDAARRHMITALRELTVRGEIRTPVEVLIHLLHGAEFRSHLIHTAWLDGYIARGYTSEGETIRSGLPKCDSIEAGVCGAIARAFRMFMGNDEKLVTQLTRGQTPYPGQTQTDVAVPIVYRGERYQFTVLQAGPQRFLVRLNGCQLLVDVTPLADAGLLIKLGGRNRLCYAREEFNGLRMTLDAKTFLFEDERDPTRLTAVQSSLLKRFLVEDGEHVPANTPFCEVEAMKALRQLNTTESGCIRLAKPEGATLAPGDLIATMELDDPSCVKLASLYNGSLPAHLTPACSVAASAEDCDAANSQVLLRDYLEASSAILNGYEDPFDGKVVEGLFRMALNPHVPEMQLRLLLSALPDLPRALVDQLQLLVRDYEAALHAGASSHHLAVFPGRAVRELCDAAVESVSEGPAEGERLRVKMARLYELANSYQEGVRSFLIKAVRDLLLHYLEHEKPFSGCRYDEVVPRLREQHKDNLAHVVNIFRSHDRIAAKNQLLVDVFRMMSLQEYSYLLVPEIISVLHELAELVGAATADVSNQARLIALKYHLPSYDQRRVIIESWIRKTFADGASGETAEKMQELASQPFAIVDVVFSLFQSPDDVIRRHAPEVYIRRTHTAYSIPSVTVEEIPGGAASREDARVPLCAHWTFSADVDEISVGAASASCVSQGASSSIRPAESVDNLLALSTGVAQPRRERYGMLAVFRTNSQMLANIDAVLGAYRSSETPEHLDVRMINVLKIAISDETTSDVAAYAAMLATPERKELLRSRGVRHVTFLVARAGEHPDIFSFSERADYAEELTLRNLEPPLAYHLELSRLARYKIEMIPINNKRVHVYFGEDRERAAADADRRFFVRMMVRQLESVKQAVGSATAQIHQELVAIFGQCVNVLNTLAPIGRFRGRPTAAHHIFVKLTVAFEQSEDEVEEMIVRAMRVQVERWNRLQILQAEVIFEVAGSLGRPRAAYRVFLRNPSGFHFVSELYRETTEVAVGGAARRVLHRRPDGAWKRESAGVWQPAQADLNGTDALAPHALTTALDRKRHMVQMLSTSYVYDFPTLFALALTKQWQRCEARFSAAGMGSPVPRPAELVVVREMGFVGNDFVELPGAPAVGENKVGMVAWLLTLRTPEYPAGRQVVVISNDISYEIGSFGVREDDVFFAASKYARDRGIPRLYISANSGARIGLAEEVMRDFRVKWTDPAQPARGYQFLYLEEEQYRAHQASVLCEPAKLDDGTAVWKLLTIIGKTPGLGVENLKGSGLIAGETSRAYDECFTCSMVTARSVGIGAYLVRLGQRVVQTEGPIILTGAAALNKVLGRDVYASNVQLGGQQVMYHNGVSHVVAHDDLEGVQRMLDMLQFVAASRLAPLPESPTPDPVDRDIAFVPTSFPFDPRELFTGAASRDAATGKPGTWMDGFADCGSFVETMGGWARSVVTGRATLGGLPVGLIVPEYRLTTSVIPPDPADENSVETPQNQAGLVWYPDSSFKTAQAIRDFNREGLPLFIFANWRGFSGGMRDLYNEILKFGSDIVDALVEFQQPVFVYIPPNGELRGGAWVVLDPSINSEVMEMYAAETARGGVLEPAGIVEIKYREPKLVATMGQLDQTLRDILVAQRKTDAKSPEAAALEARRKQRVAELLPIYRQVAATFADLHDTPGRMKAVGVIRDIVEWKQARRYFYGRLRRRLLELQLVRQVMRGGAASTAADDAHAVGREEVLAALRASAQTLGCPWDSDADFVAWCEQHSNKLVTMTANKLTAGRVSSALRAIAGTSLQDQTGALGAWLSHLAGDAADNVKRALTSLTSKQ